MKGLIFTEFLNLVEEKFGLEVSETMLFNANDDGVYTSVGSYSHLKLVTLIVELSKITKVSAEQLQESFGEFAFETLLSSLGSQDLEATSTFSFLELVESYIHKEVIKLYPDATPPKFEFQHTDSDSLILDYYSARCMGHVCKGLIKGCAAHFNENIDIVIHQGEQPNHVRFELTQVT